MTGRLHMLRSSGIFAYSWVFILASSIDLQFSYGLPRLLLPPSSVFHVQLWQRILTHLSVSRYWSIHSCRNAKIYILYNIQFGKSFNITLLCKYSSRSWKKNKVYNVWVTFLLNTITFELRHWVFRWKSGVFWTQVQKQAVFSTLRNLPCLKYQMDMVQKFPWNTINFRPSNTIVEPVVPTWW